MKTTITLNSNSFAYEADDSGGVMDLFKLWLSAQSEQASIDKVAELTNRLRHNTTMLDAVVKDIEGDT